MPSSLPLRERAQGRAGSGRRLFLRQFVRFPLSTGAQFPSSRWLARAMAQDLDPGRAGGIVELGPGTGVVTRALLRRGFPAERILALEIAPEFARFLRETVPGLTVREASAFELAAHLADLPFEGVQAVVSGLPLLIHPPAQRRRLIRTALLDAPCRAGSFVQFTYFLRPPVTELGEAVAVERTAFVPWNLYPATVWRYRRARET